MWCVHYKQHKLLIKPHIGRPNRMWFKTHFGLFAGLPLVVVPKFNFVDMLKSIVKYRITHLS